jgi:hypothetical protein
VVVTGARPAAADMVVRPAAATVVGLPVLPCGTVTVTVCPGASPAQLSVPPNAPPPEPGPERVPCVDVPAVPDSPWT